jgi:hypothetical protein
MNIPAAAPSSAHGRKRSLIDEAADELPRAANSRAVAADA